MIKAKSLRELIEERIPLGKEKSGGWRPVCCAVCNDHSERAAFIFDGIYTGANDFNCGMKFRYEEGSGKLSREGKRILQAFGITANEINEVLGAAFFNKSESKEITIESLKPVVQLFTPEVQLPPKSYPLGALHSDEFQVPLIEYVLSRALDPLKLNAHFSLDKKFLNRVILPCTRDGKIIYWQARSIHNVKPRYLSPGTNKEAVLWGYDSLWRDMDKPLFITEGIFDAASIDGIALLGSALNEAKLTVLNRCKRRKIVVIDRDDNGSVLANLALSQGWEITFPPTGITDVNNCLQKHGRLLTIWWLLKNATIPSAFVAADGTSVKSKLELSMQLTLAKLGRK